jgi:hypothetical protein
VDPFAGEFSSGTSGKNYSGINSPLINQLTWPPNQIASGCWNCSANFNRFPDGTMPYSPPTDFVARAYSVEPNYRAANGVYVIGSLEKGVTVYSQQVRAHNLLCALWEIARDQKSMPQRIAIIGGGIAGITSAACAACLFTSAAVTIFERRSDLCAIQQGSDTRWLHPRIYDWPLAASRATTAALPVLDWTEGRASDVARQILSRFALRAKKAGERLRLVLNLNHLRITSSTRRIEWNGTRAAIESGFPKNDTPEGNSEVFDLVILAGGYGLEVGKEPYGVVSYWRNDQLGQPLLMGARQSFIVSGYGDGALVDLCRLAIARFRQDSVLYDLLGNKTIESKEAEIRNVKEREEQSGTAVFDLLSLIVNGLLQDQRDVISRRLRTDTTVIMHLSGSGTPPNNSVSQIFDARSSFLNKMLFLLLYRCGAFKLSFDTLERTVQDYDVGERNVICRYGTDTMGHLLTFFSDPDAVRASLHYMRDNPAQYPHRLWAPGCFPLE